MYKFLTLTFFLFLGHNHNPLTTPSKIISISDGDTFTILQDNKQIRIRLDAIDAPENGMPFSKQSKLYLSRLCFGKQVNVKVITKDRYGRSVARVELPDGRDISTEMIKAGMAWHYKKYSKDQVLSKLEIVARNKKVGLWHDKNPIAPWEIRKLRRKGISTKNLFPQNLPHYGKT